MIDNYLKVLNANETILEHLDDIKDAFITFYGEESREFIENKFKHFDLVTFISPENMQILISSIKKEISDSAKKRILESSGIEYTTEIANKYFEYYGSFENTSNIEHYSNFIEMCELSESGRKLNGIEEYQYENIKKKAVQFLNKIGYEATYDNIEQLELEGKFDNLNNLIETYRFEKKEYDKIVNLYLSKYIEEGKKNDEIKNAVKEKYKLKLIEEFLPEELEEYKKSKITTNKIREIIGYSFDTVTDVEYFSKKFDEKLLNCKDYLKKLIEGNRIEYFKSLGIDLGNEYEAYEKSDECKKLIPDKEYIDRLSLRREEYIKQFKIEYYSQISDYKENKEKIGNFDLLCKDNGFTSDLYRVDCCSISPNVKIENGTIVENPIMFINSGYGIEKLDKSIIHEINHILELSLINKSDKNLEFITGWDYAKVDISQEEENQELDIDNKREFEMFSEIINELIAQNITRILHAKNHHIFTEKGKEGYYGSGYQFCSFLIIDFLREYLKDIIISRRNNNINHIFDVVGQDNFIKLNNLIHKFYENIDEFKYYDILENEKSNKVTDDTILFDDMIRERDEILQSMKEYSKRNVQSL